MKRLIIYIALLLASAELFGEDDFVDNISGFGSPLIKASHIGDIPVVIAGAQFGAILGGRYFLSMELSNMMSRNVDAPFIDPVTGKRPFLVLDFYGLQTGYVFHKGVKFRYLAEMAAGMGYVNYYSGSVRINEQLYDPNYGDDWFFYAEPRISALMKINDWIHLTAGAGYRIAFDTDYNYNNATIENKDLAGFTTKIAVKFGTLR